MIEEDKFKKLASNSRDWLIYKLLSERSKEIFDSTSMITGEQQMAMEQEQGENPTGETSVEETVTGKVVLVTDLAVLIEVADRIAWFPKSVIENLDKIVLDKDKIVELKIIEWFKYKIEWKVVDQ